MKLTNANTLPTPEVINILVRAIKRRADSGTIAPDDARVLLAHVEGVDVAMRILIANSLDQGETIDRLSALNR